MPCGAPASGSNGASIAVTVRAEPAHHLLQHVIAADAEPVADDLHVGVAVAEVPGEPHQSRAASAPPISSQRLGLPGHQHDRAVVEHEAVAVAQRRRPRRGRAGTSVPRSPVSTMRRRCRSPASSTTTVAQRPPRSRSPRAADGASRASRLPQRGAHNGASEFSQGDDHVDEPSTLKGKYSAAGEGNVYARANVATCKITARRHRRHVRDFRRAMQTRLRVAPAHAHQVVPGLLRGRRQRRIPARRRGVPRQEGRLRQHPAGRRRTRSAPRRACGC